MAKHLNKIHSYLQAIQIWWWNDNIATEYKHTFEFFFIARFFKWKFWPFHFFFTSFEFVCEHRINTRLWGKEIEIRIHKETTVRVDRTKNSRSKMEISGLVFPVGRVRVQATENAMAWNLYSVDLPSKSFSTLGSIAFGFLRRLQLDNCLKPKIYLWAEITGKYRDSSHLVRTTLSLHQHVYRGVGLFVLKIASLDRLRRIRPNVLCAEYNYQSALAT